MYTVVRYQKLVVGGAWAVQSRLLGNSGEDAFI